MSPFVRQRRARPQPITELVGRGALLLALLGAVLVGMQLAAVLPGTSQPTTAVLVLYTGVFVVYLAAGLLAEAVAGA